MIEFVTLFLGLMVGPRVVELAVDDSVAAVELRLDGEQVTRLNGPPWSAKIDLGPELVPHRLEAQAFDGAGRPLDQTRRLINVSSSNYAAAIALDPASASGPRTGRIVWQSVLDRRPVVQEAAFDGQPLVIDTDGRFTLKAYDPRTRHAIEVTLGFEDGREVRADLIFGGGFGERVSSSLTAIPIEASRDEPWATEDIEGWLERDGESLSIFAASAESARLFVLRDESVARELAWLRRRLAGRGPERAENSEHLTYSVTAISPRPVAGHPGTFKLVEWGPVDPWQGLRPLLLSSKPLVQGGRGKERLRRRTSQKLWESLSVAGLNAAASGGPRSVLLLLGVAPEDESLLSAAQAARYLSSVRVPLYVWTPLPETLERLDLGDAARVESGLTGLDRILRRVAAELAAQTMVWVEGEHLPSEISLAPSAPPDVRLVR